MPVITCRTNDYKKLQAFYKESYKFVQVILFKFRVVYCFSLCSLLFALFIAYCNFTRSKSLASYFHHGKCT